MDDLLTLKKKICEAIDENRDAFIALGHSVLREPETAFSEFKTAERCVPPSPVWGCNASADRRSPA